MQIKKPTVHANNANKVNVPQWAESISLPTYSNTSGREGRLIKLNRNYAYIKHMMGEIGLQLNTDYIIIPDITDIDSISIRFNEQSRQHASMCVLLWGRYQNAKIESTL
jgi:hypothetical protein